MRRCQTPNGYDYSFRGSRENTIGHTVTSENRGRRDLVLEFIGDTPRFQNRERTQLEQFRRLTRPEVKKSHKLQRQSRSHMDLLPMDKSNMKIGKIEINYNNFQGNHSPLFRAMGGLSSTRSASSSVKYRLQNYMKSEPKTKMQKVEQIYSERERFVKPTVTRLVSPPRLATPDKIFVPRGQTPRRMAGRDFNRTFMMQKRFRDDRLRELKLSTEPDFD